MEKFRDEDFTGRVLRFKSADGDTRFQDVTLEIYKKKCYCNRDFTEVELTDIITKLRKKENVHEEQQFYNNEDPLYINENEVLLVKKGKDGYYDLQNKFVQKEQPKRYKKTLSKFDELGLAVFQSKRIEKIQEKDTNLTVFTREINKTFKVHEINTCIRKIHFLSQSYQETSSFVDTCEQFPKDSYGGGKFYRGRGLLQLTHDYNYEPYFEYWKSVPKTEVGVFVFPPKVEPPKIFTDFEYFVKSISSNLFLACDSAGWYWKNNNINKYADLDDIRKVSAKVNNPSASENTTGVINGLAERTVIYNLLKPIFEYEKFHK
ncbi:hypothetical protein FNW52_20135 [Flavobacterium sp. ZT3R18]|uniref:hypothetical protein n=1 Tax=Flavobacterium sp. ZT3R18 TaxID=2594429 RepID=UPI001179ED5E|nr:hypothetical protein [Flavobacterium sp. ZT3R18]TRX30454.1 hypothetical protein FNW52_20135 [Flavobacterium sp. ZT3R18]